MPASAVVVPLTRKSALAEIDIARLQALLDQVPAPLEPLDTMALDGFLCGVLLQPREVPESRWLALVADVDGRPLPAGFDATELHGVARQRCAQLQQAIADRQWFDPWVYQLEDEASPSETVLPWVAGFAAAMDHFPALMAVEDPELIEPLALMYRHFDPDDLEDADALLTVIDTLEPPVDLAEAVEDLVRSVMLMADVTRPRQNRPPSRTPSRPRPGAARRPRR